MKNTINMLLLLVCLGCTKEKGLTSKIEGNWISSMKTNLKEGTYETNTLLQLNNGKGLLNNIGQNTLHFDYTIDKKNKNIYFSSNGKKGQLKILNISKDTLTISNFQNDTLSFQRLSEQKFERKEIQKHVIYNTFKIEKGLYDEKSSSYFFNDKWVLELSGYKFSPTGDRGNNPLVLQHYSFKKLDWKIIHSKGLYLIEITNFLHYGNQPIYGFIEYVGKNGFGIEVFINHKRELLEFSNKRVTAIDTDHLIGKWSDPGLGLYINILPKGKLEYQDKNVQFVGQWSIDNTGIVLTFTDGYDFVKFATLNDKKNTLYFQYLDTVGTSLFKR